MLIALRCMHTVLRTYLPTVRYMRLHGVRKAFVFSRIFIRFAHLGWTGDDIKNPFVDCRFYRFFDLFTLSWKCVTNTTCGKRAYLLYIAY